MAKNVTLNRTVSVTYIGWRDREHEVTVDVTYTYDGDEVCITNQMVREVPHGISDSMFDELVYEVVSEGADEDYADWLADQDEVVA